MSQKMNAARLSCQSVVHFVKVHSNNYVESKPVFQTTEKFNGVEHKIFIMMLGNSGDTD